MRCSRESTWIVSLRIFKKVDSVLRGHVRLEIESISPDGPAASAPDSGQSKQGTRHCGWGTITFKESPSMKPSSHAIHIPKAILLHDGFDG